MILHTGYPGVASPVLVWICTSGKQQPSFPASFVCAMAFNSVGIVTGDKSVTKKIFVDGLGLPQLVPTSI